VMRLWWISLDHNEKLTKRGCVQPQPIIWKRQFT
jgi:hypothetical protein